MLMTSNLYTLLHHAIKQKLALRFRPTLQNFLDDVISVNVLAHLYKPHAEVALNQIEMIGQLNDLKDFLDRSGSMSVFAQLQRIFLHWPDDPC